MTTIRPLLMSQQIKAVFADEGTLKKYNCWRTESSTIETLHHESGWSFESFHSTIPNEAGMQALIKELKKFKNERTTTI